MLDNAAAMSVRVRVAPSPTGDPHVGTAYQALFNLAFARRNEGKFILRIEDTDRARSTAESEQMILDSLHWLGLSWDEGPDVGGPHAPYRQSERLPIYREHVDELLSAGHAYRCFCTKERLDAMRAENRDKKAFPGYDRHCREIPAEESKTRADAPGGNETFVVRMKIPVHGNCVMHDLLRGEINKDWASVDDQVILKSDGFPTYHLANVVDDHLMEISHVIRGEEWINSVPKHLKLYEYFGWEPPVFCHLPLLRNNDANKSKLSKRKNPTSINYYRRAGFLPEALVNFMGMFGWTRAEGEEKFTLDEFIENLDIKSLSVSGPVFDVEKLRWLNARYIREDYDAASLAKLLRDWALGPEYLEKIVPLAQPRLETLSDWGFLTAFFFADRVPVRAEELTLKGKEPGDLVGVFQMSVWMFDGLSRFDAESIEGVLRSLSEKLDIKLRDLTRPFYVAITGSKASTPLFDSIALLGRDLTRKRLREAIELLGGLSTKRTKALDKEYRALFEVL
ncbi:MAG: glutamate--tRNA ligase [Acidobacteriota bacterium]|nr:MAG: glutamate--tRNA ligase [Acidobacteriota bacterium]